MIDAVARNHGIVGERRREFGAFVEEEKRRTGGGHGPRGDYSFAELNELAEAFPKR